MMTKQIPLNHGKVSLVDDEDYDDLMQYKWRENSKGYAIRWTHRPVRVEIRMHRQILDAQMGQEVDHINGNRLDNRRTNIRLCTNIENHHNSKLQINNTTGYKGVYFYKQRNKYKAQIKNKGKVIYLGLFKNPKEAAHAYNAAAIKLFGEFANLNKVD